MAGNCSLEEPMLIELIKEIAEETALIVMISVTSAITIILLLLFLESWIFVATKIPHRDRSISLIWMLGIFPIFAVTSQMGLFIPRAVLMCTLTASIYFAISLYQFFQLIIYYYGGHDAAVRKIGEQRILSTIQLDENSFWWLEVCVYQIAFVRPGILFIEDILWLNGTYNTSSLTVNDAYIYLNLITLISSLVAIIGLAVLYLASPPNLAAFYITAKFAIVGLAVFFGNMQILVLDVLSFTGVIPCTKPFDWESRANSWQCLLLVVESGILFPVCLRFFRTRRGNIVSVFAIPRIAIKPPSGGGLDCVDFGLSSTKLASRATKNGDSLMPPPRDQSAGIRNPLLDRLRGESNTSMSRSRSYTCSSLYNSYTTV